MIQCEFCRRALNSCCLFSMHITVPQVHCLYIVPKFPFNFLCKMQRSMSTASWGCQKLVKRPAEPGAWEDCLEFEVRLINSLWLLFKLHDVFAYMVLSHSGKKLQNSCQHASGYISTELNRLARVQRHYQFSSFPFGQAVVMLKPDSNFHWPPKNISHKHG